MAAFFGNNNNVWVVIVGLALFLAVIGEAAGRPTFGFRNHLAIQSLPRGSGSAPGRNPCTYIPGSTRGRCTLAENEGGRSGATRHFNVVAPAPVPVSSGAMDVQFATAKEDRVQHDMENDQSSS